MAENGDTPSTLAQNLSHAPGRLALARAGADGAHRDDRLRGRELGGDGRNQPEVGPGRECA